MGHIYPIELVRRAVRNSGATLSFDEAHQQAEDLILETAASITKRRAFLAANKAHEQAISDLRELEASITRAYAVAAELEARLHPARLKVDETAAAVRAVDPDPWDFRDDPDPDGEQARALAAEREMENIASMRRTWYGDADLPF